MFEQLEPDALPLRYRRLIEAKTTGAVFFPSCLCHVFTRLKIHCYISIKSKSVSPCCDMNYFFLANSAKMARQHGHNAMLLKKTALILSGVIYFNVLILVDISKSLCL